MGDSSIKNTLFAVSDKDSKARGFFILQGRFWCIKDLKQQKGEMAFLT